MVTIKGIQSGRYLAGRERSSQVYGSQSKRDHIRWRIQIEQTGEQRFANEATGYFIEKRTFFELDLTINQILDGT